MESIQHDAEMLDTSEYYPGEPRRTIELEDDYQASNRTSLSAHLPQSETRPQEYPVYTTSNNETEPPNPAKKRRRDEARESSVLATNVANMLNIEGPNDAQGRHSDDLIDDTDEDRDPPAPYLSLLPTGLCYDVRMRYHCELDPPKLRLDYHPEDPRRIFKIYKELCIAGLVKHDSLNVGPVIPNPLIRIEARDVTEAEVCLVHDKQHFDFMRSTPSMLESTSTTMIEAH